MRTPSFRVRIIPFFQVALFFGVSALAHISAAQLANPSFAIQHVDVFDGYQMLRDRTVIVDRGMIQSVQPGAQTAAAGAEIIDGRGKTLLPRLIDAHVHIGQEISLEQAAALGVTTELDMYASDMKGLMTLRSEMKQGQHPNAADFRTAGFGVTVPGDHPTEFPLPQGMRPFPTLGPNDDPQKFVDDRIAEGSDYIKIMYEHERPTLYQRTARGGSPSSPSPGETSSFRTFRSSGKPTTQSRPESTGSAHIFNDTAVKSDFASLAASHNIFVIGTLSVLLGFAECPKAQTWPPIRA